MKSSIKAINRFNNDLLLNGGHSLERHENRFFCEFNKYLNHEKKQAYYKFFLLSHFNIYIP